MIITKQKLQQLINEEYSRVLQARRKQALSEIAHKVGDTVVSNVDAQGLKKGQQYKVIDIEHGNWGTVTYGVQPVTGGKQLWIGNGHLLLNRVAGSTAESVSPKLTEERVHPRYRQELNECSAKALLTFAKVYMNLGDAVTEQLLEQVHEIGRAHV